MPPIIIQNTFHSMINVKIHVDIHFLMKNIVSDQSDFNLIDTDVGNTLPMPCE